METETNIENQPPKSSNKAAYVILALVLVMAAVLLWKSQTNIVKESTQKQEQQTQNPKPQIPQELILGQITDSSNVKLDFPDLNKVNLAQYSTTEPIENLSLFYKEWFAGHGFSIMRETNSEKGYFVTAEDGTRYINIAIFNGKSPLTVSIVTRKK